MGKWMSVAPPTLSRVELGSLPLALLQPLNRDFRRDSFGGGGGKRRENKNF